MDLPVWEVPWIGNVLPRAVAGLAVALAGYAAAGNTLFLVLQEHRAQRERDQALLSFLQDWSRFVLLVTAIVGVAAAAGALFIAAATAPAVLRALAAALFWVWLVGWLLGGLLVAATLFAYSGWGAVRPGHHLAIGWVAAGAAWLLLFAANGVEAFALSPGRWPETGRLLDGFFNETFNASLLAHAGYALALGGVLPLAASTAREPARLRGRLVRSAAAFALAGLLLASVGQVWHAAAMPAARRAAMLGPTGTLGWLWISGLAASVAAAAVLATGPLARPEGAPRPQALLLLAAAVFAAAAGAATRSAARAPYAVTGVLYGNGLPVSRVGILSREGFLRSARYAAATPEDAASRDPQRAARAGADLFRLQCAACHTVGGLGNVRALVQGWEPQTIAHQLGRLEMLRGPMPPFAGTEAERRALAGWLARLAEPVPVLATAGEGVR